MSLHRPTILPSALVTLALAACGKDATRPAEPQGSYALATYEGKAVPTTIAVGLDGRLDLLSGRIEFRSRGRLLDIKRLQPVGLGGPGEIQTETLTVAYRLSGTTLYLDHAGVVQGGGWTDTATLTRTSLDVRMRTVGTKRDANATMHYELIPVIVPTSAAR